MPLPSALALCLACMITPCIAPALNEEEAANLALCGAIHGLAGGVPDSDNDGIGDPVDAFPNDPTESFDPGWDDIGDNADPDDDNDGVPDDSDAFPKAASEWSDADGDGIGDDADTDDDNDGVADAGAPLDPAVGSPDSDGDGVRDAEELAPGLSSEFADTDGDGVDDGIELGFGMDPIEADSDADGLFDADELI